MGPSLCRRASHGAPAIPCALLPKYPMIRPPVAALVCAVLVLMTSTGSSTEQSAESIRYTLRFPAPHTHYVEVEAVYPTDGRPQIDLFMAVWTPGSYLVREYERHVENVLARGPTGQALTVSKAAKNRWRVDDRRRADRDGDLSRLRTRDDGAQQLDRVGLCDAERRADVHLAGRRHRRARTKCSIELAAGWKTSATALTPVDGRRTPIAPRTSTRWSTARSFVGNPVSREFQRRGQAPSPRPRRRRGVLRRRSRGRRRAEDCRAGRQGDGRPLRLSALLLSEHGHRRRRRARAQEQLSRA